MIMSPDLVDDMAFPQPGARRRRAGCQAEDFEEQVNGFVCQNPDPLKIIITFRLFVAGEWVGWSREGR